MRLKNSLFLKAYQGIGSLRVALFAVALTSFASSSELHAATIQIDFTNLNLTYDAMLGGDDLYDDGSTLNGTRSVGTPSSLAAITFKLDGVVMGTLTTDIFADVYIKDVLIPVGGTGMSGVSSGGNGNNFGIDLVTNTVDVLGLNLTTATITYVPGLLAVENGVASGIAFENLSDLPFGLPAVDVSKPILFAFTSVSIDDIDDDGTYLTKFKTSGTGTIKMTAVPEPAAWILAMGFSAAGFAFRKLRKSRRAR